MSPGPKPSSPRPSTSGRDLHHLTVAAMTAGTGIGVHLMEPFAPWVASAGVLSMALMSQHHHGRDVARLADEMDQMRDELSRLAAQMEDHRHRHQSRMATMATISHEIRSPLAAVIALGDLLQSESLAAPQRAMVNDLVEAGRMVMHVVNDSLDYAKSESIGSLGTPHPFSLQALLDRTLRQAQVLAADKPGLQVTASPCPVDWLEGSEAHLQQVLANLCANAVKFSPAGSVRLSVERQSPSEDGRQMLRFSVQDSGPGIAPEDHRRLFQPYSQLRPSANPSSSGSGLGLYVCRRLVELMGGRIGVNSAVGVGCEFWFTIPLTPAHPPVSALDGVDGAETHQAPATHMNRPVSSHTAVLQGLTIGVVDDARINREVARRVVEAHGGRCVLFESGDELLLQARGGHLALDLLLLDIEMPGTNGLVAAEVLRSMPAYQELPIVAVSGAATDDLQASLRNGFVSGFLPKPFHAKALTQKILAHRRGPASP